MATAGLGTATAQPAGKPHRIDVHHHIVPPAQRKMNIERQGGKGGPAWSVQMSLDDMDKAGVAYSITSILNPGPWYGKIEESSRRLARECNDYAAKLRSDHPNRFGIFAAIAPVDVEGSLKEIEYAYGTLKAEGIALWTSYDGKYLGNETFVPVLEELNRRKAVVYVHPTPADCCAKVIGAVPPSAIEYATDTTRTVASLIFEKPRSAVKFPDIRWIWSHSGGTIPFLTSRFTRLAWERKMEDPVADHAEALLRDRAGQHARPARGADEDGLDLAGDVRIGLSVPRRQGGARRDAWRTSSRPPTSWRSTTATR